MAIRTIFAALSTLLILGTLRVCHTTPITTPPPPPTSSNMSATAMPTAAPLTPHQGLGEVLTGVRVLKRATFQQMLLGGLYNSTNASLERGFYAFSVLMNSLQMLQLLQGNSDENRRSDNLTALSVILSGVLNDSCRWFQAHLPSLDCSNRANFVAVVLSMGLTPHLNNLECFLRGMDRFTENTSQGEWVSRTFATTSSSSSSSSSSESSESSSYAGLGCVVCSKLNLDSCRGCAVSQ